MHLYRTARGVTKHLTTWEWERVGIDVNKKPLLISPSGSPLICASEAYVQSLSITWLSGETMPIHIWMPIKLLSPRCDALPVLHVKQNGKAVIICFNYFIFSIYLLVHLFTWHSWSWLWRGRAAHSLLEMDRAYLTSRVWFLWIWLESAQKKPPSTHPLIGNDRIGLNIGIDYGGVKLDSHRGAVFTTLPLNFMPMNSF